MERTNLRIGLLQCGHVHPDLVPANGDYPELFDDLLAHHGLDLTTIDVANEAMPESGDFDGWLITGSANSVYDDLPWIAPLEDLVRQLVDEERPVVAVCFGHQLVAQACGGQVARSDAGWGAGAHDYEIIGPALPWMVPPASGAVRLLASHQDQVLAAPRGATVYARTDHCPIAGYTLGPNTLAIQPHPEFTVPISRGLSERRRDRMGVDVAEAAIASLDRPIDRDLFGGWMAAFLHQAHERQG